jgi:hypothetical protein
MPSPCHRPRAAATVFFALLQGSLGAIHALSLAVLCLSAAGGNWADLPSFFLFAVGSGCACANSTALDLAT